MVAQSFGRGPECPEYARDLYRWPAEVRDEVFARLLALNADRAVAEARVGTAAGPPLPGRSRLMTPETFSAIASDEHSAVWKCAPNPRPLVAPYRPKT